MATYSIGEAAERSGFPASTLRYYEDIGLVPPAGRTPAGYRRYDDGSLARLAFVARAKQLGCTLDEVVDLVGVWDGDACGPVQRRLHELVTAKLASTRARLGELAAFTAQLAEAAAQLGGPATDGPCDAGCACFGAEATPPGPVPVALTDRPTAPPDAVPVACTLDRGAMGDRMGEWEAVLAGVVEREDLADGGLRLVFGAGVDGAALARLVAAEQACCAFFAFTLTVDTRGLALEVRAPAEAEPFVSALFGAPA